MPRTIRMASIGHVDSERLRSGPELPDPRQAQNLEETDVTLGVNPTMEALISIFAR